MVIKENPERLTILSIVLFAAIAPIVLMTAPAMAVQISEEMGVTSTQVGDLFSIELGALSIASLPAYWWLRTFDWRKIALLFSALYVLGNIVSAGLDSYSYLFIAVRFITSFAGGSLMVICLSSAPVVRSLSLSRMYGLWLVGQLALGAIGLSILPIIFDLYGLSLAYILFALFGAISLPFAWFFPKKFNKDKKNNESNDRTYMTKGLFCLAGLFGFYVALSGVWTFVGSIANSSGISDVVTGNVLAIGTMLGVAGALVSTFIGDKFSRFSFIASGFIVMTFSTLLFLNEPSVVRFIVAAFAFKFTWTYVLPFVLAHLSDLDNSGMFMNASNFVIGAGLATGPGIAGRAIDLEGGFSSLLIGASIVTVLSMFAVFYSRLKKGDKNNNLKFTY